MDKYKLFVFVRTDMDSMCVGRAMAQVSHATSHFEEKMSRSMKLKENYLKWKSEGVYFGTTIIMNAPSEEYLKDINQKYSKRNDLIGGWVFDPEYYIKDGSVFHRLENVLTCMWIFAQNLHDIDCELLDISHYLK